MTSDLYAPHAAYGGPLGLKTLVNACHKKGLAVVLDVVYNHLGPEGNYLSEYGPYFTDRYQTPWGQAVNFDGEDSREVRRYFIDNALYWVTEYHIDALRLDAIHGIFGEVPDPQDPQTFTHSVLHHDLQLGDPHRALLRWYHDLIALQKSSPALRHCSKEYLETILLSEQQVLLVRRWQPQEEDLLLIACFSRDPVSLVLPIPPGQWRQVIDANLEQYGGTETYALPLVLPDDASVTLALGEFAFALYRHELGGSPKGAQPGGS